MKQLITFLAICAMATSVHAGKKCKGTAKICKTVAAARATERMDIVDTAVSAGSFQTLVAAVKAAGLVDTLKGHGPLTVFAPTDEAFAKLPQGTIAELLKPENKTKLQGILAYHVVAGSVTAADVVKLSSAETLQGQEIDIAVHGEGVTVDGAKIVKADIHASNGVIHVIDTVLLPADKDIVETAAAAGSFTSLVAGIQAAGLVETLKGEGPFTVFAPSDDAVAKLPEGTIESLLNPENKEQLAAILTYHVIAGKVMAADVVQLNRATSVLGKDVAISVADGNVRVNGATIVATDIETSNGVIHVIDSVLLP
jgi:uncharacterized surface protein with fasciclin (FAS1) repeats